MKRSELKELIKTSILEDYSQDISDVKSEINAEASLTEAGDFPDDIEWEFSGEIIDQMDQYNATIGLVGHSESTGKDYAASAEASRGGAGGDWEWMEEDEVEELAEGLDSIAEADAIVEAWNSKKKLTEEMHGGYIELMEMNPKFDEGLEMLLEVWNEWKSGEMTEPEMIDEAREDLLAYLASVLK